MADSDGEYRVSPGRLALLARCAERDGRRNDRRKRGCAAGDQRITPAPRRSASPQTIRITPSWQFQDLASAA